MKNYVDMKHSNEFKQEVQYKENMYYDKIIRKKKVLF
jgi:hypothetical protein